MNLTFFSEGIAIFVVIPSTTKTYKSTNFNAGFKTPKLEKDVHVNNDEIIIFNTYFYFGNLLYSRSARHE